ncbi:hypothetical protein [Bacillus sp. Au-Bac7]|uniref:hypothetical protein n=1 Tax=Bacillus sp. Au-Bac7 TaxID=2906458 RepID=UPI001E41E242|nr:hypothetical protein [Bacillus sp. Au-Bac7]MCE4048029.1 hypothetical protein [Bacillus sp. Au-Bac7]
MIIEFKMKSRYNGKRFNPGEQSDIPEDVAKRLVKCGAAFFIEKKEVVDLNEDAEDETLTPPANPVMDDFDENDKDYAKLLDKKFLKDVLKEAAMEVGILVPSFDQKKDELIALIIQEGKAEEVLALPNDFNE